MFENLNKKLQHMITGIDGDVLQNSLKTIAEVMDTEEGKQLTEKFNSLDKEKLIQTLEGMDQNEVMKQLDSMNLSELSGKINSIEKEQVAKILSDNPNIINKIDKFINNN